MNLYDKIENLYKAEEKSTIEPKNISTCRDKIIEELKDIKALLKINTQSIEKVYNILENFEKQKIF
jgi:hypothetical protein